MYFDLTLPPPQNICFYSSFIFLSNVFIAVLYDKILYAILFLCLFTTSLIFHSTRNRIIKLVDQAFVLLIVSYGFYQLSIKLSNSTFTTYTIILYVLIIFTFLVVNYLYFSKDYCFHENKETGDMYHSLLHVISSIGHNLIIIL